ncbi:serine/threonine-protein kinase Nek10 [Patella vulgata]|uniref:serine/threonine-protein kinase Nek10 n=1 Tax=Patella vulgata TaxID=6465 RepID=UPI0024A9DD22|nr:serine/threonine-protein kinase Nek10 [Patella vulgata]
MPATERKTKSSDQTGKPIKRSDSVKELKELDRLLKLLTTTPSRQQLPAIVHGNGATTQQDEGQGIRSRSESDQQTSQAVALHKFSLRYQNERNFSNHKHLEILQRIFTALTKHKLCCSDWLNSAPQETVLRVLICLRIMMRDCSFQTIFFELDGVKYLSDYFQRVTEVYLTDGVGQYVIDILKEMTNIFQKLSVVVEQRECLVQSKAHVALVQLLSANELLVLHCALHALIGLAQSPKPRYLIGELNSVEFLLRIIQQYDTVSKKLASNLLCLLCRDQASAEKIRDYDGIPVLLSQLNSENLNLLWHIVWCLAQLCEDSKTSTEIRLCGGIPLLLSLLHDRKFVPEKNDNNGGVASAGIHGRTPHVVDDQEELPYSLKSACCAALTELVLNDTNAEQIAQANGIYALGLLILPQDVSNREKKPVNKLQRSAFRTLRFLFSMERNRWLFKRLFPVELFELFIDVGHYNKDLSAYKPLVDMMNSLSKSKIDEIKDKIFETNQNRNPSKYIGEYSVFELLGSGAFGSVYKVKKTSAEQSSFLALKELNLQNPAFGKNSLEVETSVGEITNELQIMREQLKHPNIVRYYKTFVEAERLYIVMDLIEGAPLLEHFNSLKEKKERFHESRVWNIFLQMVLALRYLHKEKNIVHRDLTPSNIMLDEHDKITITDFGLAKQKRSDCSKMTSVVGTILYSCPEIVQHKPYGEKADIWAFGCILYQLCTLEPPFFSANMLSLVTKIVEAKYEAIPKGDYSSRLINTVYSLIKVKPENRPDILEISAEVVDLILIHMDNLRTNQSSLEKKLDRERKRTQKHVIKSNQNMQKYLESEERYDRLLQQASSHLKNGDDNDVFKTCSSSTDGLSTEGEDNADRGWTSDDESNPSSGSESRGSSAGSTRSRGRITRKPRLPLSHNNRKPYGRNEPLSQLILNIPSNAKSSRDSGLSSGDPSPNMNNSPGHQCTTEDILASPDVEYLLNSRPYLIRSQSSNDTTITPRSKFLEARSRSTATLSMSPNRLREINDPIVQMLVQLHKIIYITQLPPTLSPNYERRKIDQFKRALFSPHSNSINLKSELKKLMQGSPDMIDVLSMPGVMSHRPRSGGLERDILGSNSKQGSSNYDPEMGITYEQLNNLIEKTLSSSGYYSIGYQQREKTPPISPLTRRGLRNS